ncbi:MAG TPA: hypothetical protein VHO95_06705 [Candidatus Dormibacteraeota bacterium]|nr:hypothetical protein [Candidatus Dormibacteraeota bacterium]
MYLEEVQCSGGCPDGTNPSGKFLAMNLSARAEQPVTFAPGDGPLYHLGETSYFAFHSPEFWPNS